MSQEFTIKSQAIEDKINQLLPSQGGFQPGVDISASTMVIPIVDLTETAEGSSLRVDLQSALSFNSVTAYSVSNATTTVLNTTGYWRIFGTSNCNIGSSSRTGEIIINDGATDKTIYKVTVGAGGTTNGYTLDDYDFIVKLIAGDSLIVKSSNGGITLNGSARQLADINGNLISP
jgi:hypothetical protein